MLGKNLGKTGHSRKKKPKKGSTINSLDSGEQLVDHHFAPSTNASLPVSSRQLTIPRKFGSDMATIRFADDLEPLTVDVVLHCELSSSTIHLWYGSTILQLCKININLVSSIAKQILFTLEPCMFFERRAETWIAPLTMDAAYLHVMIFTSRLYLHGYRNSSLVDPLTLPHYVKALKILRERFASNNDQASLSFTTAATVMALTGYAHITGDARSARNHLEGLHRIVSLRGGVGTFKESAKLLVEILRYCLSLLKEETRMLTISDVI